MPCQIDLILLYKWANDRFIVSIAVSADFLGKDHEGCGCIDTEHKCCPDNFTPAEGPRYQGCLCHTYKYGCCPDGIRVARGPGQVPRQITTGTTFL